MSYYPSQNNTKSPASTPIIKKSNKNCSTRIHIPVNKTINKLRMTPPHQINRNTNITHNAPKKQSNATHKMKPKPFKRIKLKSNTHKTLSNTHCKSIPNITSNHKSIHNPNISGGGTHNNNYKNNNNHHKYKRIKNNLSNHKNIIKTHKTQTAIDNSKQRMNTETDTHKQQQHEMEMETESKQSDTSDAILMLPNIETIDTQLNEKTHGKKRCNNNNKQTLPVRVRKKRKISLRVPKCKVGDCMECMFTNTSNSNNEWRLCRIIAIKSSKNAGFLYYVHYTDYNRRLDEWVIGSKLRKCTGKIKKPSEVLLENTSNKRLTRGQKRAVFEQHHIDIDEIDEIEKQHTQRQNGVNGMKHPSNEDELYESIHLKTNKIKNIEKIQFGKYIIDCWYFSPYPEEYIGCTRLLYICQYCLKYMKFYNTYMNHCENECFIRHPPGNEIYRHDGISVWEIDGCIDKIYCQNLCLLAKLFFDHKTLYFDVSPFLFYIICEYDTEHADGFHLVGYFSKEKNSPEGFNLACILTMPHKQKLGYGRFIISLSYELSKKESKIGSPEKPLSDLGKISYKSFWIENILQIIESYYGEITIKQISELSSFTKEDIINSLKEVNMLNCYKGQHVIKYRAQSIKKYLAQFKKRRKKRKNTFHPKHLHWNSTKIEPNQHPWNGLSSFHK